MQKYLVYGSIIVLGSIGLLVLSSYSSLWEAHQKHDFQHISWQDALEVLLTGTVDQVFQYHNRTVELRLHNSVTLVTKEPEIDAIWRAIQECGSPCKEIILATE